MDYRTKYDTAERPKRTLNGPKQTMPVKPPAMEKQRLSTNGEEALLRLRNRDMHGGKLRRVETEGGDFQLGRLS